ncbi:MAG: hypothetical protein Tsb0020_47110 [Haliangiales bacterium]
MKSIGITLLGVAVSLGLSACQPASSNDLGDELAKVSERLGEIEEAMKNRPAAAARPQRPQRPRPDPKAVYSVPIEGAPYKGPEQAKVTIVKAFEYACPFCSRVLPTLEQIQKEYGDDVRIVYKNYLVHPAAATTPALAACAAHKQGKYNEMSKLIWEKGFNEGRNLSRENMDKLAGEVGLDMARYKADIDGDECKKRIQEDQAELARVGVSGTPAFYINGRFLSGAQPFPAFKVIIDEELKKAEDRLAKGDSLSDYYAKYVVEKGEKKFVR